MRERDEFEVKWSKGQLRAKIDRIKVNFHIPFFKLSFDQMAS